MTGMHYVLFHKVNHQDEGVVRPFFKSFKENFVQATVIWLFFLAAAALIAALVYFPRTILMAAVLGSYGLALWNFPLRLTPLLLLFGFVFPWYICALLYKKVLLAMEENSRT